MTGSKEVLLNLMTKKVGTAGVSTCGHFWLPDLDSN